MADRRGWVSFRDALDMNDACGMAEGAAWALAEEMSGVGIGGGIDAMERVNKGKDRKRFSPSYQRRKARRKAARAALAREIGGEE